MGRLINGLVVLSLAVTLSLPAQAASRRDDGDGFFRSPIKKVVQLVKKLISAPLDDISFPKP